MCLDNLPDIHYLAGYQPHDGRYGNFDSNILLCAFKIMDIYTALCNARFNSSSFQCDNFGQLVEQTPLGIKYMKQNLYQNALFSYNIAIDLTWQLGWLFLYGSTDDLMPTAEFHDYLVKQCSYDNLIAALKKNNHPDLITIYTDFYKYMKETNIRTDYNYLKHRGNFYYEYPIINRKSINLETVCGDFESFDKDLLSYIRQLIDKIMPSDYLNTNNPLNGMMNYNFNYKDQIISYNEDYAAYKRRIKYTVQQLMIELCNYIKKTKEE